MRPLDELVEEMVEDALDVLIAPPSILRYLADRKISLDARKIISVAEVLTPLDREVIEQHFQCTVHQLYTSTEGEIAATCEHGTLHLNEEIMVIQKEWIDDEQTMFHPCLLYTSDAARRIMSGTTNSVAPEVDANSNTSSCRPMISEIA